MSERPTASPCWVSATSSAATLASYLRLGHAAQPSFELSSALDESDFILADADHAASVQLVAATERLGETVFIGSQAPADAVAWMTRPIDPMKVMRELGRRAAAGRAPSAAARLTTARPECRYPPPGPRVPPRTATGPA